jgi:hypothetical protein
VGSLRLVARAGAGNVFADTDDIGVEDVRWGVGAGLYAPTRIGPVWLDVGVRDGGKTLVSLGLGGY